MLPQPGNSSKEDRALASQETLVPFVLCLSQNTCTHTHIHTYMNSHSHERTYIHTLLQSALPLSRTSLGQGLSWGLPVALLGCDPQRLCARGGCPAGFIQEQKCVQDPAGLEEGRVNSVLEPQALGKGALPPPSPADPDPGCPQPPSLLHCPHIAQPFWVTPQQCHWEAP